MTQSLLSSLAAVASALMVAVGTAPAGAAPPGGCTPAPRGLVFAQDFERLPAGTPGLDDEREFRSAFCPAVRYFAGFGSDAEPPLGELSERARAARIAREAAGQFNGASDVVRLSVDRGVSGGDGQSLRVLYPQGTNTSSHSGAQFEMPVPGAMAYDRSTRSITGTTTYDELYLRYRVRVDEDFDWAQGGKLPGLWANDAAGYPDPANEVSARLMWRAGGTLEFYLHTESDERERLLWDNVPGAGHATLNRGQWHTIEFRLKLNTPGRPDGIWQGWLDNRLVADYRDLTFRSSSRANLNTVFFSTFHGGSSGSASSPEEIWWPNRDGYAWFDGFQVATAPIGRQQTAAADPVWRTAQRPR